MELIINAFLITLGIGLGLGVLAVLWTLIQIGIVGGLPEEDRQGPGLRRQVLKLAPSKDDLLTGPVHPNPTVVQ